MEKARVACAQTIILRQRNPPHSCRNSEQVLHQHDQEEVEFYCDEQWFKFRKGIADWSTNYESYDKIFEGMPEYIRSGRDQVYLFGGHNEQRLETFLGSSSDPGLLPIFMIYLLQEKYREPHQRITIRISFIEYRGNQFFDLLAPTHTPLRTVSRRDFRRLQTHCWIKVSEYIEFLRLLKIALFKNHNRDFRVSSNETKEGESIFVAQLNVEIKNSPGEAPTVSTIYLVDVEEEHRKEKSNVKTEWDYLCQCLKSLRKEEECKTDKNTFAHYLEPALSRGITRLAYCMSNVKERFGSNLHRLTQLKDIYQLKRCEGRGGRTGPLVQIPTISKLKDNASQLFASLDQVEYSSYRHLSRLQQAVCTCIDRITQQIDKYGAVLSEIILTRAQLQLELGCSATELWQLIGSSVKTEHIKDFYSSKTYVSLYREVAILTEKRSKTIAGLAQQLYQAIERYERMMKKQPEFFRELLKDPSLEGIVLTSVTQVVGIARGAFNALNNMEAGLYVSHAGLWIENVMEKVKLQNQVRTQKEVFTGFQSLIGKLALGNCRFKQERILAESNIISKTMLRLQQSCLKTKTSAREEDEQNQSSTQLPRLMFKKIKPQKKQELKPEKRYTIRLSDFLFRINKECAQDVLKEKPLPKGSA